MEIKMKTDTHSASFDSSKAKHLANMCGNNGANGFGE